MANIYVRSTDGNDTDNGSTWALAKATLAGAASIDLAGDTIYLSQSHAESVAAATGISINGTLASPVRIVCGNDAAEPPTAVATTATVTRTGANSMAFTGHFHCYGVAFTVGDSTNAASIQISNGASNNQTFENCSLILGGNNSANRITIGGTSAAVGQARFINTGVKFANASQAINLLSGDLVWEGGSLLSGGTSPTNLFAALNTRQANVRVTGVDFSNADAGINFFTGTGGGFGVLRNCKLPASWSGSLASGTLVAGGRWEMHNCDAGDTNYRILIADALGTVTQDTGVYLDGGKYDGTTRLSYKHASTASCNFLSGRFYGPELVVWNETTGSSVTATVQIVHDGASALTDGEVWLEVCYLGTSGYPLGTWASDAKADVLATASAQTTSSETWTGDTGTGPNGSTTWNQLKLSVTFTPQEKGPVIARVVMGVASKTVFVDPNVILS